MYFNAGLEVERKVERNKLREFISQPSTKFSQHMYFKAGHKGMHRDTILGEILKLPPRQSLSAAAEGEF